MCLQSSSAGFNQQFPGATLQVADSIQLLFYSW